MTKAYKILVILFSMFLWGNGLKALDQKDGVYQISTAEDLMAFSEIVNGGEFDANAVLTGDIDLGAISYFPPIGKQYHPHGPTLSFNGTFDGQGHIIYNLRIEKDDSGAETGLFGRLDGATIRNLGIVNATFKNSNALRAGVLGGCSVNSKITNCFTTGNIVTDECVCSYNHRNGSGLIGQITSGSAVSNCYTTYESMHHEPESRESAIENCYWGDTAIAWAATGELCAKLNVGQNDIVWYQTLGEDAYPSLDNTHKQVYVIGNIKCDGTFLSGEVSYTNDKDAATPMPPHDYVEGVCTECGNFDPGYVQIVDGWYEVSSPDHLLYISELVNSGMYDINVRLTSDIDLGAISYFPPIGKQYYPHGPTLSFNGTFDGQGHIIYNLRIEKDDSGAETGLFGRLDGATIRNLGIVNATFKNSNALRAGVLGGCSVNSKITNCFTTGNIVTDECVCSFNHRNGSGLIGLITSGSAVSNCYTTYESMHDESESRESSIENCYWGDTAIAWAATGELCAKLNVGQNDIVWYQTLGEDAYPSLDNTHKQVYVIGNIKCDGTFLSGEVSYTNDKDAATPMPPHDYVEGVCTECGNFDPGYVQIVDGWYEVSSPDHLLYISELVNSGMYDINVRLTSDIDLGAISYFPPIGKQYHPHGPTLSFNGTFDGQGHIIYNLRIEKDDEGAETGLFGRIENATVKNLGIVNATLKNNSALRAGVLGGSSINSNVINCFSAGEINMGDCICSYDSRNGDGLFGLVFTGSILTNCYTTYGTLGNDYAPDIKFENCYWGEDVTNMVHTGELCYKLNSGSFIYPSWYQTIGEDEFPVLDNTHGIVYATGEGNYASFPADASLKEFQDIISEIERMAVEEVLATQAILDECLSAIEGFSSFSDKEGFYAAYNDYISLKKKLQESMDAYAAYKQKAEEVTAYLEANEGFQGELRNQLVSYLSDEVEPNEVFEYGSYVYIMHNHTLTTAEIQAETIKLQTMLDNAIAADYAAGTDVTKLLVNADFKNGWNGWNNGLANGSYFYESTDVVGCEAWNTDGKIEQTIEELKNGIYLVSMTAAYRPSNDPMSYAYNAYIYLNDNCVYIPTVYETYMPVDEAKDGVNCNLSIPSNDTEQPITDDNGEIIGYAIHGSASVAVAAAAGRSMCHMVANVTDGKLTIGVNNLGSKYGSDWTGWANIRLTYLGSMEQADEQLNTVLEDQIERANTLLNRYYYSSDTYYSKSPNFSNALRDELTAEIAEAEAATTPEGKYAVVEKFSQTFKDIYTSKRMYIDIINNVEDFVAMASELYPEYISEEENDAVIILSDAAWTDYENGTLDYEKTMAQLQALSFIPKFVDGWYEVDSPAQLWYISNLVNSGITSINVRLTADLDFSEISYFPPIGRQYWPSGPMLFFNGTFDGQGHIIYNLRIEKDDEGAETGLFGRIQNAIVKNLGIVNATLKNNSALRAGVLGGSSINSNVANCFTTGEINMDECICSYDSKNGDGLFGLVFTGSILTNCYTTYGTLGNDYAPDIKFENCYWGEEAIAEAPTGELCYKLNGDQSTITWFQKLGEDAYPVLNPERGIIIPGENGSYENATGIQQIANEKQTGHTFNLMGQKVQRVTKGIYIIGDKKILVK